MKIKENFFFGGGGRVGGVGGGGGGAGRGRRVGGVRVDGEWRSKIQKKNLGGLGGRGGSDQELGWG